MRSIRTTTIVLKRAHIASAICDRHAQVLAQHKQSIYHKSSSSILPTRRPSLHLANVSYSVDESKPRKQDELQTNILRDTTLSNQHNLAICHAKRSGTHIARRPCKTHDCAPSDRLTAKHTKANPQRKKQTLETPSPAYLQIRSDGLSIHLLTADADNRSIRTPTHNGGVNGLRNPPT